MVDSDNNIKKNNTLSNNIGTRISLVYLIQRDGPSYPIPIT